MNTPTLKLSMSRFQKVGAAVIRFSKDVPQVVVIFSFSLMLGACEQSADKLPDQPTQSSPQKTQTTNTLVWSEVERKQLDSLSIKHLPRVPNDPSNRYQSNPAAIALGAQLFFDPRLSATGTISCSVCHQPNRQFSDGLRVASGIKPGLRNTPSLVGVAHQQWLFWDGRKDSVWAQALEPFENPAEHNLSRVSLLQIVFSVKDYKAAYQAVFGKLPAQEVINSWPKQASPQGDIHALKAWKALPIEQRQQINRLYANLGKAIAAYESTLAFQESRFDRFISSLSNPTSPSEEILTQQEQQGLKLFLGKAACMSCHHSPLLSNSSFQNIGTGVRGKDLGRAQVAEAQAWDVFNCLGDYSDAPKSACNELRFMNKNRHELSGSFKVPSLRNVSKTAPYMHDGRFASLAEVVRYYTNPPSRLRSDHHLPDIQLSETEQAQLLAFLKSL